MIQNKFIRYNNYDNYDADMNAGDISEDSIVIVKDKRLIHTSGTDIYGVDNPDISEDVAALKDGQIVAVDTFETAEGRSIDINDVVLNVEQTLTTDLKLQTQANILDKPADSSLHSNIGYTILKINEIHIGLPFLGIVQDVQITPTYTQIADKIVYDSVHQLFLAWKDGLYYQTYSSPTWSYYSNPVEGRKYYYGNKTYHWTNEGLLVYSDDLISTNILTQEMLSEPNMIYVIKYDYDLNDNEIQIPSRCTLKFEGGSFSNGTIVCDETNIIHDLLIQDTLINVTIEGTAYKNENGDDFCKDKEYNEQQFSGLGRRYIKKNITYKGLPFDRFVDTVGRIGLISPTLKPDEIVFCRETGKFYAVINTVYFPSWAYEDAEKYSPIPSTIRDFVCTSENRPYHWDALTQTLVAVSGTSKNILTQDMINEDNTIYIIQYDYDLNGKSIRIPENCVLKFEGGSLDNGSIFLHNCKIYPSYDELYDVWRNLQITGHPHDGTTRFYDGKPIWAGAGGYWIDAAGQPVEVDD